jgi:hypothetical protein
VNRSAVSALPIELRTLELHRMSTSAADREQLLWRIDPVERPTAYGGCTLKPVIGPAIVWLPG